MTITIIAFLVLLAFMVYTFLKLRPKKADVFPKKWEPILENKVKFYRELSNPEKIRFKKRMMVFLSEIYIDSVNLEITDLDRILIAASAVIPVFNFPEFQYTNLSGVILYPDNFNDDLDFEEGNKARIIAGMVGNGRLEKQMIISKKALHKGFENPQDKNNTAIHEFVHLIDKLDGQTDGVPERLIDNAYTIPWLKLIHDEMEKINKNKSDIRSYGGTNQQEFFAVASEYFFEQPEKMKQKHPEIYKMLAECFNFH
ncbi:hypothetical protein SAMN03097699_0504 [Flavobacteriaceae bacterium MAR_2010_188]|nr:hypothetical protein SAMN03097699_0504 [Flavobacteriaceae bacterium MAR_2010_188]